MSQRPSPPRLKDLRFAVLATDVAAFRIVEGELLVLLGRVNVPPFYVNRWGLIGGLIRPDETAEQSVDRLLRDKAGIGKIYREQLYTFSAIDRDPRNRVVSVGYLALTAEDPQNAGTGSLETRWLNVTAAPKLAYDHNEILAVALERLRSRIGSSNIVQHLLPRQFTLSELQRVFEIVLDRSLDKRNFRKKIGEIDLVKATGQMRHGGATRPAALYGFHDRQVRAFDVI